MQTTIISKTRGKVKFISQQYVTGLYVAIYRDDHSVPNQLGLDVSDEEFHTDIRGNLKRGWKVIPEESSVLGG